MRQFFKIAQIPSFWSKKCLLWRSCSKRKKLVYKITPLPLLLLLYIFGVFDYCFEKDYDSQFEYPLQVDNLISLINMRLNGVISGVEPVNEYNFRYVIENENKCKNKDGNFEDIRLLIIVKSAIKHVQKRTAIRNSWGYEKRFSDVRVKRIFVVGSCDDVDFNYHFNPKQRHCQDIIDEESEKNADIVQADFVDNYYNNTVKTMLSMKWASKNCQTAQFIFFVDDDYYVSLKNLLKFIRNPFKYGDYTRFQSNPFESPDKLPAYYDGRLYAGFVFKNSKPHRHKFSKWAITLKEYPYSKFPPYVTAGAIVMSQSTLVQMYYASLYTQHFRFDDIYVGLLAKRINVTPYHCSHFYFWKKHYLVSEYRDVIASHGFDDTKEMINVWESQKSLGFA